MRRLLPLLLLAACDQPRDTADTSPEAPVFPAQIALRADGWLRGDLHMHTTYSDGWDSVATVVALGEYLAWSEFLAFHPEYLDNQLDFMALSDHRTVDQNHDPDFHSDSLVLIPSEEFGSSGHANTPGVSEFVNHDPDGDGVSAEDYQAAVEAAHAQGALFSPNHPFSPGIMFPWDITGFDTIEVWNCGWLLASPATTQQNLDDWTASRGTPSATYARAIQEQGRGGNAQGLIWYEALLSRGEHVGLVGGSDRHVVILPGFPTTYVQSASADVQGLVDGMRARHTFVTRTPASAQLLGEIVVGDATFQWGDQVPVPTAGAEVTLRLRVARAEGGLARIITGGHVESDEALATAPLGSIAVEQPIDSQDQLVEYTFTATPGDWAYPLVLDSLLAPGLTAEQQQTVQSAATACADSGDDAVDLAMAIGPILDTEILATPEDCDPDDWVEDAPQCATADTESLTSYFIPDFLDRAINAWTEDSATTGWSMGAVASAVLFVEE
ncbi:MAG: CehA/McbA family metallohydrolase [Pseudomonadota bacterium]